MIASLGADTFPRVGLLTPAMIFINVDLPAPFFPINAMRSFSLILKVILLKREVPLNSTLTASTEIMFLKNRGKDIIYFHRKEAEIAIHITLISNDYLIRSGRHCSF